MRSKPSLPEEKKLAPEKTSQGLASQIQLLRMRVAAAESTLENARDQASHAKVRQKLAKMLAKRARKGAKQAKAEWANAKIALARAEDALIAENALKKDAKRKRAYLRNRKTKPVAPPASSKTPTHIAVAERRRFSTRSRVVTPPVALLRSLPEDSVLLRDKVARSTVSSEGMPAGF